MTSALGDSTRRLGLVAMGVLLALLMIGSFAANDASAKGKKAKKAKVTITVTTKNQAALTKSGKVTVKVKSTAKAKVSLSATLSGKSKHFKKKTVKFNNCLLYTSDAADDLLCVDLGGRRIIKKKTKK